MLRSVVNIHKFIILNIFRNKNYYEVLNLSQNATPQEIKNAYFELSKKYHPDNLQTGNENKIKLINEAYSVLSKPKKKFNFPNFNQNEFNNPSKHNYYYYYYTRHENSQDKEKKSKSALRLKRGIIWLVFCLFLAEMVNIYVVFLIREKRRRNESIVLSNMLDDNYMSNERGKAKNQKK